jgi:Aspartyl protease
MERGKEPAASEDGSELVPALRELVRERFQVLARDTCTLQKLHCADDSETRRVGAMAKVSFDYLHHLVTVPVTVNDVETRFVLDSGIGLTLVSGALSGPAGCRPTGRTFTGRRMSGQDVTLPLAVAPSITFAGSVSIGVEVGILDMSSFPPALADIGGFLSLAFFADRPLTVDYPRRAVVVETPRTSARRRAEGVALPVDLERDGPSVTVFLPLTIPGGRSISAEVDMGSDVLILDERFAEETGASLEGGDVRLADGTDETGGRYVRRFTRLPGPIHPTAAPQLAQDEPEVMFQRIIHDGLVGEAFLRRFAVTFDVESAELVLAPGV